MANTIELQSINAIYERFLKPRGCISTTPLVGKFSYTDACILSADTGNKLTNILVEHKHRDFAIVEKNYHTAMIDLEKVQNIQRAMNVFDCAGWIAVEYYDVILIFNVSKTKHYDIDSELMPTYFDSYSGRGVMKSTVFFPYRDALYIISKKNYELTTYEQLQRYFEKHGVQLV